MLIPIILIVHCSPLYAQQAGDRIEIGNKTMKYVIDKTGKNISFIDRSDGKNYLATDSVSYCAYAKVNGVREKVRAVSFAGNKTLHLDFGKSGVAVDVQVQVLDSSVSFEVIKITGTAESLNFLNIPLDITGLPSDAFASCALALNVFTHVEQLPALQTHLWAECYARLGIKGARVAFLGVPQKYILPAIRSIMLNAKDVPASRAGGAWAQLSKEGYGSYLMNFGAMTEKTTDEWIAYCKSVGFNQVDSHGGTPDFFNFGSFELNPRKWPDGWNGFKRINQRLHKAGISSIFHTYAFFIDKASSYVTPVPSDDLGYFRKFTLAKPLSQSDTTIVVNESTEDISLFTGFHFPNSLTLKIGKELIEFSGVTRFPPYTFTGCKRGADKTTVSNHAANDTAFHLVELFGRFAPGAETPLFTEIAANTAKVVNENEFDGIYLDAIDGSDIYGSEFAWYYSSKFIFEIAKRLKRPVGMEMSAMSHLWWHYRSRWQAWDVPRRGYKRFVDIHASSIKSNEHDHGYWRGHTPEMYQYGALENGPLQLPLQLGWWNLFTFDPPNTEAQFSDDIEYLGCKMIGNNAGLAMSSGYQKKDVDANPAFKRLNAIIRQYEILRQQNYFSEDVKKLLREPGKEFTLIKEHNGGWSFKRASYQQHKVSGSDSAVYKWTINNEYARQPLKLRIQALMAVKSYEDTGSVTLADFSDPNEFTDKWSAKGVTGKIVNIQTKGERSGVFNALSSGVSPQKGSWIKLEKQFLPWKNLLGKEGLGVWVKGDGNGELLNLRLETPEHLSAGVRGDHYIKIDFTGWKYFELVEIESARFTDYIWPGSEIIPDTKIKDLFVYKSYLHSVQFDKVDKLQLWYNNVPEGKEINCEIRPVKALPMVPFTMQNPCIEIAGRKIVFPVEMKSGMYIEFNAMDDCRLYGPKGEFIKEITPQGVVPDVFQGENVIQFSCAHDANVNPRALVTAINYGETIPNK